MSILSTDIAAPRLQPRSTFASAPKAIMLTAAAVVTMFLLRTAWVSEDSYISFRVLDNFLRGYGLRWNIDDRVQTYTDPLFLAIVTGATWMSGNVYLSAIAVSLILTLAAFFLIMFDGDEIGILTASVALIFSKAFMDFSISGLENPATDLAVAAYLFVYWRRRDPFTLSLIAALAATNRMDTLLLFLPSLIVVYWRTGRPRWKPILLGWSPFLAWSFFSLFYYGFLFPNTAYAKLSTGIPTRDLIFQGIVYYLNALRCDTATLFVIFIGLTIAYFAREWMLGLGVLLNLLYILRVGGDFMSARFFGASVFICAALIARYWKPDRIVATATIALIGALGMWVPAPTVTSASAEFGNAWPVDSGGVADERAYYYAASGLLRYHRETLWPDHALSHAGEKAKLDKNKVVVFGYIGMFGYNAGPAVHIIDPMGLGDAFLARLPMKSGPWRVGHYERELPAGYVETLQTGVNKIADPNLHQYWDHLHTVIAGNLFSLDRFKEILLFNSGYYHHLIPARK